MIPPTLTGLSGAQLDSIELIDETPAPTSDATLDMLRSAVLAVACARIRRDTYAAELRSRLDQFERANVVVREKLKEAQEHVASGEVAVRTLAVQVHAATGAKKPLVGIEVKPYKTIRITDPAAALAWCQQKDMALVPATYDEDALFKLAAVTPLPFVEQGTVMKASIATTLSPAAYTPSDEPSDEIAIDAAATSVIE